MINREIRSAVYERDGYRCVICGEASGITLDHILPVVEGGSDEIKNLQTLCYPCNYKKGGNLQLSFWQRIKFIWNIDVRLQSNRKALASEFRLALKEKANEKATEARFKDANNFFSRLLNDLDKMRKESLDTKNTINGTVTNDRKQSGIKFLEITRKIDETEYQISEIERAFVELVDFLGIEYGPNGFKNKQED